MIDWRSDDWHVTELEFGTLWCELQLENGLVWLEWNPRVFAYRCGFSRNDEASRSTLGFADSLEEAMGIAEERGRRKEKG
jgi:hypothetical protein